MVNGSDLARRDLLEGLDVEVPEEEFLRAHARVVVVVEDVERIILLVLGVDAVGGKAPAQAVGAVVHERDALDDVRPRKARAAAVDDRRNGAPGGDAYLAFAF